MDIDHRPRSEFVARFIGSSPILKGKALDAGHVEIAGVALACTGNRSSRAPRPRSRSASMKSASRQRRRHPAALQATVIRHASPRQQPRLSGPALADGTHLRVVTSAEQSVPQGEKACATPSAQALPGSNTVQRARAGPLSAVLAPHRPEHPELDGVRLPPQVLDDLGVLLARQRHLGQRLLRHHRSSLLSGPSAISRQPAPGNIGVTGSRGAVRWRCPPPSAQPHGRQHHNAGGRWLTADGRLLEVVAQLLGAGGVAQLAQRLGLDLADPLAGHAELPPDLLQRPRRGRRPGRSAAPAPAARAR